MKLRIHGARILAVSFFVLGASILRAAQDLTPIPGPIDVRTTDGETVRMRSIVVLSNSISGYVETKRAEREIHLDWISNETRRKLGIPTRPEPWYELSPTNSAGKIAESRAPEPHAISAVFLGLEYEANEVRADALFKGRWLIIEGEISHIGVSAFGVPYVTIDSAVTAYFPKESIPKIATMDKGDSVHIGGRCGGLGPFNVLSLSDCVLLDH